MHIFLYGPPGSGKSTVGKQLARNLKLPFIDLDQTIESNAGMSIPQIMEQQGETTFRDLESAALQSLTSTPLPMGEGQGVRDCVIALGGGALLRDENRALAESNGQILFLTAEMNTLMKRISAQPGKRPLLAGGDLEEKLTTLHRKRHDHYSSFPLKLHVDGKTAEQNAFDAQILLGRHHLSAMGEYDVVVGAGFKPAPTPPAHLIVTDENVAKHHLEKFGDIKSFVIPAGEEHKTLETIHALWKAFLENGLDRKSTVIALGGGVVTDMVGFAASSYMRGINWIALPTTLLGMVDASIGGKTGFDLPEGKNLIGAFYPPNLIVADARFLSTLPERELISGMAEVVKHGIISDPELFDLCLCGMDWVKENLEALVKRAMAVKIKVIEEDPYEKGFRAALNLGHTVGHAVELVSKFELRHGEAIAIGMVVEAQYAQKIGLTNQAVVEKIIHALKMLGLPTQIPEDFSRAEIIKAMRVDKKKTAKAIRFALPVEIGKVELVEVDDLESVLDDR